jgi:hypothetical protein
MSDLEPIELDPADPFEAALIRMVHTNRRKRNDYTVDPKAGPFWNFEQTAAQVGTTPRMVVEMNIAQKQARLCALWTSGREPANEAVDDTILDRAVYSVIALAMLPGAEADLVDEIDEWEKARKAFEAA